MTFRFSLPEIRSFQVFVIPLFSFVLLAGCDLAQNQLSMDRAADLQAQDFRDGLAARDEDMYNGTGSEATDQAGIPPLSSYVDMDVSSMQRMPLVSVSVNQTVPLRDVIYELAEQADFDVELDPRISGSIIFRARNRPFDVVIDRIADIAGLRYKFDDNVLRVELDEPYQETYKIAYLSYIRQASGTISNNIAVVTGEGADTGSDFEVITSSESDFWAELDVNVSQILGVRESRGRLRTGSDPRISAAPEIEAPLAPVGGGEGESIAPPQAVLEVDSLPTNIEAEEDEEDGEQGIASFSLNRQAGLITVYATERQHKEVERYLKNLERSVASQVLIEAKVFEVSLRDEYSAGIDWRAIELFNSQSFAAGFRVVGESLAPDLVPLANPQAAFIGAYESNNLNAAIEAVSRFGTIRALASPRLTVLNNQAAVLNVATNQVYFDIDIDVERDDETGDRTITIESEIENVPEGVLINVQPSINPDDGTISLAVRPTVTRIVSFESDPGIQFIAASENIDIESLVPVVNVQEMDSVIRMDSGEAVVMGGLMQDRTESTEVGTPVLSEVPLLGSLFKTHSDQVRKTELVVFLKATIMDGNNNISQTDKDMYRRFAKDRRPLDF